MDALRRSLEGVGAESAALDGQLVALAHEIDAIAKDSTEAGLAAVEAFRRADEAAADLRDGMLAAKEAVDALARGEAELGVAEAAVTKASDLLAAAQWRLRDAMESARNVGVEVAAADADLARAEAEVAAAATAEAGAIGDAVTKKVEEAASARAAADADRGLAGAAIASAAAQRFLADAARDSSGAFGDADRALLDSANAAMKATGFWARWGNVIHWVTAGSAEFLAVAVPAMIAFGAAMLVGVQGAQMMQIHLQSLWTAAEATGNMFHETMGQALGLKSVLQQAQDAANPKVYALLGAGLGIVREQAGHLATAGLAVIQVFDEFAARLRYDFSSAGGAGQTMGTLLKDMVPDLVMFGQVLGNIGHAVLNLASKMPGLAELLLKLLDAASKAVEWFSTLPTPLIMTAMAMEEIWRWGQPLVAILTKLPDVISAFVASGFGIPAVFGRVAEIFRALLGVIPNLIANLSELAAAAAVGTKFEGLTAAVAGFSAKLAAAISEMTVFDALAGASLLGAIVGIGIAFDRTRSATQQWIDSMNRAVSSANQLTVLSTLGSAIGGATAKIQQQKQILDQYPAAMQHYAQANAQGSASLDHLLGPMAGVQRGAQNFGNAINTWIGHALSWVTGIKSVGNAYMALTGANAAGKAAVQVEQLTAVQQKWVQQAVNVVQGAAEISREFGTNFVGSLMLAQAAGVKLQDGITGTGEAAGIARMQIADYVQGWQAMGQDTGAISGDMELLAVQAGLSASKVQQLTQAMQQFDQNLTGGTSGLAGFITSLDQVGIKVGSVQKGIGNLGQASKISLPQVNQFAASLKSMGGQGAQAWTNFNQIVGQTAPQLIGWFQTAGAEGMLSGQKFHQGVLDMLSGLVPLAKDSKTAQAEVIGLGRSAGLQISSWSNLKDQIKNAHASLAGLQPIIDGATQGMANLGKVAQNLGDVMQADIVATMDKAKLAASGLSGAAAQVANDLSKPTTPASVSGEAIHRLYEKVLQLTGSKAAAQNAAAAMADGYGKVGRAALNAANLTSQAAPKIPGAMVSAINRGAPAVQTAAHHMVLGVENSIAPLPSKMRTAGSQGSHGMQSGISSGEPGIIHAILSISDSISHQLNQLPGQLMHLGAMAVMGLVHGLESEAGAVASAVASLASLIPKGISSLLHMGSPSRVTMQQGEWAAQGLAIGLTSGFPAVQKAAELLGHIIPGGINQGMGGGNLSSQGLAGNAMQKIGKETIFQLITAMMGSVPQIKAAMKVITDAMKGAMSGFGHGGLVGWNDQALLDSIKAGNQQLLALAKQRDKIAAEIKAATQYAAQVSSNLISSTGLAGVQQPTDPKTGKNLPWTAANIQSQMTTQLNQLQAFDHNIDVLRKMGLNKTLLNQIIQAGYQQGGALAQALAHGSAAQIKSLNATEEAIIKASKKIGNDAANAMYDTGKNAGKGFLSGLKSQEAAIEKLMEQIAEKMIKALEKALKIKSPSQEMYDRGMWAAQGLAKGLLDGEPIVLAAAKKLATAVANVKVNPPKTVGPLQPGGPVIQIAPGTPPAGIAQPMVVVHQHIAGSVLSEQQLQQYVQSAQLKYTHRNNGNGLYLPGRGFGTPVSR